jgi:hypothetical protein
MNGPPCLRLFVRLALLYVPTKKLSALVELERQVLTVTFYLESIRADSCRCLRGVT